MRAALLLLAGAPAAFAAPSAVFDGAGAPAALVRPAPPPAASGRPLAPAPLPPDLGAAAARFGSAAMISRLPPRPTAGTFAFGVVGDAEPGRFAWERVFNPGADAFVRQWNALQSRGPDFVLQLGDFVSEGDPDHYRAHLRALSGNLSRPIFHTVGNHDRSRPNGAADKRCFEAVFGQGDYFFDHSGWRFVSLDSSDRAVTGPQLAWLEAVLSVPGPKVVFTHVPPAYLGGLDSLTEPASVDAAADPGHSYLYDFFTNYFVEGSEEFRRIVESSGVKAVYMGHIHAFWAAESNGVRYVISGGGGSPLYPLPKGYPTRRFAHTLWVEAGPNGLTETVLPMSGGAFPIGR